VFLRVPHFSRSLREVGIFSFFHHPRTKCVRSHVPYFKACNLSMLSLLEPDESTALTPVSHLCVVAFLRKSGRMAETIGATPNGGASSNLWAH
jgi:hypothetical protein